MSGNKLVFTIFGATGDLCHRKLMPSLYNLYALDKLTNIEILALGRREYTNQQYYEIIKQWINEYNRFNHKDDQVEHFLNKINYLKMDISNLDDYQILGDYFKRNNYQQYIMYYAVAPLFFEKITLGLKQINCTSNTKIIIEKPFGANIENANLINDLLIDTLGERNIYRIDHYLGKEMVQGILDIRFKNAIFLNAWNNQSIESIYIIAHEKNGIENRGAYYDSVGALKDMVQNHLMQLMTIIALEKPADFNDIFPQQSMVLNDLQNIEKVDIKSQMLLGQYQGYLQEKDIKSDSKTESYALLKLYIDNPRWQNVPFYIETGKKMDERYTRVEINFKAIGENQSKLTISIQPQEGIEFTFNMKKPGITEEMMPVVMEYCQSCVQELRYNTPEAYERLIEAVILGDNTWFSKWPLIEQSWKYIDQLKKQYIDNQMPLVQYQDNQIPLKENVISNQ